MTALQTRQSSIDTLNSQQFFRIFQEIESSGDIFEIDTGVSAVCVGPQSDLADFCLFYFDEQDPPDQVNELVVAVANPFIGRLDSLNVTSFPTQNQPARLTLATRDLVDNSYLPRGFVSGGPTPDTIARFRPRIDVISYLQTPSQIAPLRANRVFNINNFVGALDADIYFVFPYYGRRQGTVSITNLSSGPGFSVDVQVRLTRLGLGTVPAPGGAARNNEILLTGVPVPVGPGEDRQIVTRASDDGQADLLVVRVTALAVLGFDLMMDVGLSDREA